MTSTTETGGRHQTWRPPAIPARLPALRRREYGLFLLGIGAIALHIVDENFLQPQPGTSAGDHLASGRIPLAVLAATYPRLLDEKPIAADGVS